MFVKTISDSLRVFLTFIWSIIDILQNCACTKSLKFSFFSQFDMKEQKTKNIRKTFLL